jgi:hypothetical protein
MVLGDVYAERFTGLGRTTDWTAEAGTRVQLTPRTVIDFGIGRRFTGFNPAWLATLATTVTFGFRPFTALHAHGPQHLARYYHQTYLPSGDNWRFHSTFPDADHLFNAFDYGHSILYERLWTRDGAPPGLETRDYDHLVNDVLRNPSRVPLDESAIAPGFTRLAPEALEMFEWAHMLHRQVYDALADGNLQPAQCAARIAAALSYYRSRRDLAFSSEPIGMQLMDSQSYSGAFRTKSPKFNGLIWSYHWLQMEVYESLLQNETRETRKQAVANDVKTFFAMLADAPAHMPAQMPMSADIAPEFVRRFPDLANIFDNLHSFHDVVSDILADPRVPRAQKRTQILHAAALFRGARSAPSSGREK